MQCHAVWMQYDIYNYPKEQRKILVIVTQLACGSIGVHVTIQLLCKLHRKLIICCADFCGLVMMEGSTSGFWEKHSMILVAVTTTTTGEGLSDQLARHVPKHALPERRLPWLQVQLNEPTVFTQRSHFCVFASLHSSWSAKENSRKKIKSEAFENTATQRTYMYVFLPLKAESKKEKSSGSYALRGNPPSLAQDQYASTFRVEYTCKLPTCKSRIDRHMARPIFQTLQS